MVFAITPLSSIWKTIRSIVALACFFLCVCHCFCGRVLSNDFIDSFSSVRQAAILGILLLAYAMSVSALSGSVTPTTSAIVPMVGPVTPAMSMSGPATPTARNTDAAPQYLPQLRQFEHKVQKDQMRLLQRKLLEQRREIELLGDDSANITRQIVQFRDEIDSMVRHKRIVEAKLEMHQGTLRTTNSRLMAAKRAHDDLNEELEQASRRRTD